MSKETIREQSNSHDSGVNFHNQYTNLFKQAHIGIVIFLGPELIIDLANDTLLKIWGKSKDVVGKPFLVALPEIKDTPYPQLLLDVFNNGVTHHANENSAKLIRNGKEELVYFNFVFQPFYEENGKISGVIVIANEVTDQIIARKKVEESENKLCNILERTPTPILILKGPDMVLEVANESLLKLWNVSKDAIGKKFLEILPEMQEQGIMDLLLSVYDRGEIVTGHEMPIVFERNTGEKENFYFNFVYQPYREADGSISGVLVLATDVTGHVLVKKQLSASEEHLRIAVDTAEMGTWEYSPLTNIIDCSARTKQLFGFGSDQLVTLEMVANAIIETDRERALTAIHYALNVASAGNYSIEYTINDINTREERTIKAKGKVFFDDKNTPVRVVGTALDITEHKRAAQNLERLIDERTRELKHANEKLAKSNEELERFAHVASHDLKEPLRKITIFSSILKEDAKEVLNENCLNYVYKIEKSAERLTLMIEGVLKYSSINKVDAPIEKIDLNEIIKNIETDLELLISQKKAVIQYETLPQLEGMPFLIYQLFYNLFNNALKFSKADIAPHILISTKIVSGNTLEEITGIDPNKTYVEIKIKDNGIGFAQQYKEKIFHTFTRLNAKDKYEGTGLGLSLCKSIVARHDGFISAEGVEGQGATFTILLPEKQD